MIMHGRFHGLQIVKVNRVRLPAGNPLSTVAPVPIEYEHAFRLAAVAGG
jgi:hypothetical protein